MSRHTHKRYILQEVRNRSCRVQRPNSVRLVHPAKECNRLLDRIEELEGRYDALKAALTYDDGDVIRTSVKGDSDVTDIINQIESEFNDLL